MIYNFNQGIGWASSGVEYAQAYRAGVFRLLQEPARFIFTDMFPQENIEHMTRNIGFEDEEIIWLYQFFTDCHISPVTYTMQQLLQTIGSEHYKIRWTPKGADIILGKPDCFYRVYYTGDKKNNLVHRVEMVQDGKLIRKDYYTYCRIYSEYFAPLDGKAHLYLRRFFNENGTTAYEEILDETDEKRRLYRFRDELIDSREELIGLMIRRLQLTKDDIVIIDRNDQLGQTILSNCGSARVGVVIHADHFSEGNTDEHHILWNNYYEYVFAMHRHIDFYITATEAQKKLLQEQFRQYLHSEIQVYAIPVGALQSLSGMEQKRKPFSLITASRLASEKHVDWIIQAVADAHEEMPELTLDIYGKGGLENSLRKLIGERQADAYIRLMGQHKLDDIYPQYEAYISASTSEGFGLTLMEAVGAGLPLIGYDVRYGNPTFIRHEKNGYLIPYGKDLTIKERTDALKESIVRLFKEADLSAFHSVSYEVASAYLKEEVMSKWKRLLSEMRD